MTPPGKSGPLSLSENPGILTRLNRRSVIEDFAESRRCVGRNQIQPKQMVARGPRPSGAGGFADRRKLE